MPTLLVLSGVAAIVYGLHRLALLAEARGWIFYKTRPPRVRMLGLLEELVEPRVEYLIEEQSSEAIRADHAQAGQGKGRDEPDAPG